MTATDAALPRAPSPEECDHPSPVEGVLAHEFGAYAGARGPEGKRRTVMYYGPVLGGLPIEAWHCERCGLLRLAFPDGRREERRLWPGPQPGLIAVPVPDVATPERATGRQPRVSGVTAPQRLVARVYESPPPPPRPVLRLPSWDPATAAAVALLVLAAVGLLLGGVLATYDWTTPGAVLPLFYAVLGCWLGALGVVVADRARRHFSSMAPRSPSPAERWRGRPQLRASDRVAVALLVLAAVGLLLGGVLATYDWTTPGAVLPLFFGGLACFLGALLVEVTAAALRRLAPR